MTIDHGVAFVIGLLTGAGLVGLAVGLFLTRREK
jgi:hypothetical protein